LAGLDEQEKGIEQRLRDQLLVFPNLLAVAMSPYSRLISRNLSAAAALCIYEAQPT
jgi:hypothetical protein